MYGQTAAERAGPGSPLAQVQPLELSSLGKVAVGSQRHFPERARDKEGWKGAGVCTNQQCLSLSLEDILTKSRELCCGVTCQSGLPCREEWERRVWEGAGGAPVVSPRPHTGVEHALRSLAWFSSSGSRHFFPFGLLSSGWR